MWWQITYWDTFAILPTVSQYPIITKKFVFLELKLKLFQFTYGVNAWKHWVVQKNAELEKLRAQGKYMKTFETDILKLRWGNNVDSTGWPIRAATIFWWIRFESSIMLPTWCANSARFAPGQAELGWHQNYWYKSQQNVQSIPLIVPLDIVPNRI